MSLNITPGIIYILYTNIMINIYKKIDGELTFEVVDMTIKIAGKKQDARWTSFQRSSIKPNKSVNRYRAMCSYCNEKMDGRLENLPTHIKNCIKINLSQRKVYFDAVDATKKVESEANSDA